MIRRIFRGPFDYVHSLRNWKNCSKFLEENKNLEGKYKNRRCFVIGNGGSINSQDLSKLKNEITIVSNSFFKHPSLNSWQPTYYCIVDSIHFSEIEFTSSFFSELTQSVKTTNFCFPVVNKEIIDTLMVLNSFKKYFFFFHNSLAETSIRELNLDKPIPGVQSVSQFEIMLAIYMGCSPIYLMGMDHDWLKYEPNMDNERSYQHFYSDQTVDNYAKRKYNYSFSYKTDLVNILRLWEGYENLLSLSVKEDIKILNATKGGYLDVFERIDYEKIFKNDQYNVIPINTE